MTNPFSNIPYLIQQFQQFSSNFQGDPKQQVQQMLNSGQMSQDGLNAIIPLAQTFYGILHRNQK